MRPSGNDKSFRSKLGQKNTSNSSLRISKIQNEQFEVRHFAGTVSYHCKDFVDMNRDRLLPSLLNVMKSSQSKVLQRLYTDKNVDGVSSTKLDGNVGAKYKNSSKSASSLTAKLKMQVTSLLNMLSTTNRILFVALNRIMSGRVRL